MPRIYTVISQAATGFSEWRVGRDLRRAQLEAESVQHALLRSARWVPRSTMVHVAAGPPAIPDGGRSPVRFCPWRPDGRLPRKRAAAVLPHLHPCPLWCASTGPPGFAGPPGSGDAWSGQGPRAPWHGCGLPARIGGSTDHVHRPAPAGIAPPGSCARPHPSRCLGGRLGPRVSAGGGQPLRGGGPARRGLGASGPAGVAPPPAALEVPRPVSSLTTPAVPPCGPGRRSTRPGPRLQYGALGEAAVLRSCAGPQGGSPPRSLLPRRLPP
jgi:hypothetical protein